MCLKSQCSESTRSVFQELCELMWDPPRNASEGDRQSLFSKHKPVFHKNDLIDVFKATIQLKWYSWFEKIAAAHEGALSTSFFGWVPEYFHRSTVKIDKWFGPLEKGYVWCYARQGLAELTLVGYPPRFSHTLEPNSRSGR